MNKPETLEEKNKETLQDRIPQPVKRWLEEFLKPGEELVALANSDLTLEGEFAEHWLVVTNTRWGLLQTQEGFAFQPFPDYWFPHIEMRVFQGTALLQVKLPDKIVPILRFTFGCKEAIERALEAGRKIFDKESAPSSFEEASSNGRYRNRPKPLCSRCGKPIPHWLGICPDCLDKRRLLFRLFQRVLPHWHIALFSLILMLLIQITDLVQPQLQRLLIDEVIVHKDLHLLKLIILGIVGLQALNSLLSGLRSYLTTWFGERLILEFRNDLYRHIQTLSLGFYDAKQTGWIMDRITADTNNLQDFLATGLQDILRDLLNLVIIIGIMLWMDVRLTLLTLLPTPILFWMTAHFMRRIHRLFHRAWRKRARLTALLADVVPGVRVVKAFARERHETHRFELRNQDLMQTNIQNARVFSTFWPTFGFISSLGFIIIWGYGTYRVIEGGLTLGYLTAFINYLWRFYAPLNNLSRMTHHLQRAATAAQRVFEILDTQPDVKDPEDRKPMPRIQGRIEFRNVTFGYNPYQPVLKNVSFVVEPGQMVGLVGPSGAGKSTTVNLLCRFYDVQEGSILIDGIDIREVTLESLREQIGVVLQDPFLFHGSIAENIAYGKPDATMEEIIQAAKAANAHDFIMQLPEGYDTLVGERGTRLSGGERQRISIARAILRNPRILILDEATSSVDTETEAQIREAINRLIQNRTTIAIAHRLSTLRNADRLIVLDNGQVVEMGTHEELMAKEDGLFRRLCQMQRDLNQLIAVGG